MKKNFALLIVAFLATIILWGLFFENSATVIMINGQQVESPFKGLLGAGGLVVALIALICMAILLALVFAGTGMMILGCIVVGVAIFTAFMVPFSFPLLIPLALVWAFVALIRKGK